MHIRTPFLNVFLPDLPFARLTKESDDCIPEVGPRVPGTVLFWNRGRQQKSGHLSRSNHTPETDNRHGVHLTVWGCVPVQNPWYWQLSQSSEFQKSLSGWNWGLLSQHCCAQNFFKSSAEAVKLSKWPLLKILRHKKHDKSKSVNYMCSVYITKASTSQYLARHPYIQQFPDHVFTKGCL